MNERDWIDNISSKCEFASYVRGGAMCYQNGFKEYCDFRRCPILHPILKEKK